MGVFFMHATAVSQVGEPQRQELEIKTQPLVRLTVKRLSGARTIARTFGSPTSPPLGAAVVILLAPWPWYAWDSALWAVSGQFLEAEGC